MPKLQMDSVRGCAETSPLLMKNGVPAMRAMATIMACGFTLSSFRLSINRDERRARHSNTEFSTGLVFLNLLLEQSDNVP